jgi:ADP-heptose:LPS heptosyltransferase
LNKKVFKPLKSTHQRYADVFEKLGFQVDLTLNHFLPKQSLSENFTNVLGNSYGKWIGIAPFAAFEGKMYPLDLMENVVEKLQRTDNYRLILFGGGQKEKDLLDGWAAKYKHCVNIVGKLNFEEELKLISNLDLMLSMDSGNAHLAAMFGIPTVTLWGVTHPYAGFYPFGQDPDNAMLSDRTVYPLIPTSVYGNKVPHGYEKVMETISPDAVVEKISQMLT